jgi:hypothetical protein
MTNHEETSEEDDPNTLGWQHGYDDLLPDCPYSEDSEEAKEYWLGYKQGCADLEFVITVFFSLREFKN